MRGPKPTLALSSHVGAKTLGYGFKRVSPMPSHSIATVNTSISACGSRRGCPPSISVFALLCLSIASTCAFADGCKVGKIAEFPIAMVGLRPLMTAAINDVDVQFLVDSGAFYSMISTASAAELKLRTSPAPLGFYLTGVHGTADASIATAKTFTLAGVSLHNVEFLVGGSEAGAGSLGLLGQKVLHID